MRRVYLRLKDTALAKGMSVAYSTAAYEALLKKDFGTELRMMDVTHPKYVCVCVVYVCVCVCVVYSVTVVSL